MAKKGSGGDFRSFTPNEYCENISDGLLYLEKKIKVNSKTNLQDLNIRAEEFFREFLNILFSWKLESANATQINAPGIDLFFPTERIGVQVSSTCSAEKIRHSIALIPNPKGMHFYFVAIRDKYKPTAKFDVPKGLIFDPKTDILDIGTLMEHVSHCGIDKQKELSDLVDKYIKKTSTEPAKPAAVNAVNVVDEREHFEDKWNGDAFLSDGVPLKDIYCPPECCLNGDQKNRLTLSEAENKLKVSKRHILLIQGQPGIGKSTLVAQFVCTDDSLRQIIVFRCQGTGIKNWSDPDIYDTILSKNKLSGQDLTNCILILDGLDEIAGRESLDTVFSNLITSYNSSASVERAARLVITCRENYIEGLASNQGYDYISLCPFDENQIRRFCKKYRNVKNKTVPAKTETALCRNKTVYGIPLITYMVMALGIEVQASSSIVDVYDQIFDLKKGGIYGRFHSDQAVTGDPELWKKLHGLSQDMALWIFNNKFEEAEIPKEAHDGLDGLDTLAKKRKLDPQMGLDYFRKLRHNEGSNDTVSFVHRSMMEYFTADAVARVICPDRGKPSADPAKAVREISRMLWWQDLASGECPEYLEKMLSARFKSLAENKKQTIYQQWELAVFRQLEAGVPAWSCAEIEAMDHYHRQRAATVSCQNLLWVREMIRKCCKAEGKIGAFAHEKMKDDGYCTVLPTYIQASPTFHWHLPDYDLNHADLCCANLSSADLRGADMRIANLRDANLCDANLRDANLGHANLSLTNLRNANLRNADLSLADLHLADLREAVLHGADLRGADLRGADLRGADLRSANLCNANLRGADLRGADLRGADLSRADLSRVNLSHADLTNAVLFLVNLCDADLSGADLRGADLNDAWVNRETAASAIRKLKEAKFDTIKVWDGQKEDYTNYTREEFFSEFDQPEDGSE